jgi:hypothetical protein
VTAAPRVITAVVLAPIVDKAGMASITPLWISTSHILICLIVNPLFPVPAKQEKSLRMMRLVDLPMAERARAAPTTASAVALMVSVAAACSTAHILSGKHVFPAHSVLNA